MQETGEVGWAAKLNSSQYQKTLSEKQRALRNVSVNFDTIKTV